jgi:hypothetical protein
MIHKHVLVPQRLRRPPATGWSWLDRRFLREHGDYLSREAVLLYLFLAAVPTGTACRSTATTR